MPLRVITEGPLRWELGLEYAVCAVALLITRGRDVTYDVIGTGPERDRVLYTAFDLGIERAVRVSERRTRPADVVLWPHLLGGAPPSGDLPVVGPGIDPRRPDLLADALGAVVVG